ncbi:MAG: AraC family transcriptional regulator [Spirochaetota bacterium]
MKVICKSHGKLPTFQRMKSIFILVQYLESQKIPTASILQDSGISLQDLQNPDKKISLETEFLMYKNVLTLCKKPEIGLLLAANYHLGIIDHLGIAIALSDTFLDAIEYTFQYMELTLTYFQYELFQKGTLVYLKMRELVDLKELREFISEREFVSMYRACGDILGVPFLLREVHLAYEKPRYGDLYRKYFMCPILFGASENMFIFDHKVLEKSLPKANPLMRKIHEQKCEETYKQIKQCESVEEQVTHEILFCKTFHPSMEFVAGQLGMTSRTLRRHLASEGTSYQKILTDTLKKQAMGLLHNTKLNIEEIAAKLHYSEAASFSHAFKKWTGCTPGEYRNKVLRI